MTTRAFCPVFVTVFSAISLAAVHSGSLVIGDMDIDGPLYVSTAGSGASTGLADDILPVADGTVYSATAAVTNQYVIASYSLQGALEFAAFDTTPFLSLHLALNPYALPLYDPEVGIYGYGNADGAITGADYNAGVFLGTLTLPPGLGYGQDALFNVTDFVRNVPGAYFGFSLRTDAGTDVFSSMEYNYGKPSRLVGTPVPEPSTCALVLMTTMGALWWARRRR
jgi:hypothetical protein